MWPSPEDKTTIQAIVRGVFLSIIAQEMAASDVPEVLPHEPQAPDSIPDTDLPEGEQTVLEEGDQHLIDFLDLESTENVVWIDPRDRPKASKARLAQFTILSRLDITPDRPVNASDEVLEWPELRVEQERPRPARRPLPDDLILDAKRLRRG